MTTFKQLTAAVAAAAALIVTACGGGGGGEGGGIGGTGISYGGITALGSIWVNGVEFDTTTTAVRIDDNPGVAADLKKGMVVRVDGSIDASRADNVLVEGSIKGFVEGRLDANRFTLMGQTIQTDDLTVFDPAFVPAVGERVEVHGLVVADGVISGGLVSRKTTAPTPPFAVKGLVKNHDTAAKTFAVGALTVNYTTAAISDLSTSSSWNGQLVEVKGSGCAGVAPAACGTLTASSVHASGVRVDNIGRAEVEGFVTVAPAVGGSTFTIGTQPVSTSTGTVFVGGVIGDVLLGSKLEVEGAIRGGVLVASKVRFLDSIRLEADVDTLSATGFTLVGMPGIVVSVNALTEFDGFANLAAVQPGDHVRVRARPAVGGGAVALEVEERNGGNGDTILQATVDAVAAPTLTLLGQVVDTTTISNNEFKGLNDAVIGRSAFFAAVKVNTLVKARGTPNGNTIAWNQIELED
jgi:Domain of unknown function (DUF5666)